MTKTYPLEKFASFGQREAEYVSLVRETSPAATRVEVRPLWSNPSHETWGCDSSDGFPIGTPYKKAS
ncbi:MAG: hypothetical protein EOM25_13190 [Deltaproteobacteria bacterium]|nr:hypothetical protein [Deltaproteobacteria bacterium]